MASLPKLDTVVDLNLRRNFLQHTRRSRFPPASPVCLPASHIGSPLLKRPTYPRGAALTLCVYNAIWTSVSNQDISVANKQIYNLICFKQYIYIWINKYIYIYLYTYICIKRYLYKYMRIYFFRQEILLVFSALIITGISGGNYYWYCGRRYYSVV